MVLGVVLIPISATLLTGTFVAEIIATYYCIDLSKAVFTWPVISLSTTVFTVTLNESLKRIFL